MCWLIWCQSKAWPAGSNALGFTPFQVISRNFRVSTNPKIAWNDLKWCEAQSIWPCGSSFWLTSNQSTHAILGLVLWFQRVLQGFIGSKLQVKLKLSNCLIVFQIGVSTFLPRFHQVFYLDFIKFKCGRLHHTNPMDGHPRPSQNETKTLQGVGGITGAKRHEIASNFLEPPRLPQPCLRQKCVRP